MAVATPERLEEIPVNPGRSERRVIGLEGRGERVGHARVAGAENHEEVRVRALEEGAVRPGISRPTSMEIYVRNRDL